MPALAPKNHLSLVSFGVGYGMSLYPTNIDLLVGSLIPFRATTLIS